ncbi:hypothetical protein ACLOJK_025894 [Asimina triloba]
MKILKFRVALLTLYDCGWCVSYQQLVSRSSGGLLQQESSMTNKLLDVADGASGLEDKLLDVADGAGGLEDENLQGMKV